MAALDKALALLSEGTPIYRGGLGPAERELLRGYFLLTNKPVMAVVNVGEGQMDDVDAVVAPVAAELGGFGEALGMSVQLEAEAAQLDSSERSEMLEALGLGEGALPRFVHTAYHLLGLRTFFTTGPDESRAWTFRAGSKAPQAAGRIHSDFERRFIRAEVIHWDELLDIGSWAKAREVGKLRSRARTTRWSTATSSRSGTARERREGASASERTRLGSGGGAPGISTARDCERHEARPGPVTVHGWLRRDGEVLASLEIADDRRSRRHGLLGRDGVDGALLLPVCRSVHTFGMGFPIDVALCASDGSDGLVVRAVRTLRPGRITDAEAPHERGDRGRGRRLRTLGARAGPAPRRRALRRLMAAPGALVLVGTPIGNLGDLSPRAVEALAGASLVCCEDTRRTGRLLQHAGHRWRHAADGQRPHRGAGHRRGAPARSGPASGWRW